LWEVTVTFLAGFLAGVDFEGASLSTAALVEAGFLATDLLAGLAVFDAGFC
jgi:uncharacterized protein YjbI with pentapeptide repeats